jgi:hypothetical protein
VWNQTTQPELVAKPWQWRELTPRRSRKVGKYAQAHCARAHALTSSSKDYQVVPPRCAEPQPKFRFAGWHSYKLTSKPEIHHFCSMYSFGSLLWEMIHGERPWADHTPVQVGWGERLPALVCSPGWRREWSVLRPERRGRELPHQQLFWQLYKSQPQRASDQGQGCFPSKARDKPSTWPFLLRYMLLARQLCFACNAHKPYDSFMGLVVEKLTRLPPELPSNKNISAAPADCAAMDTVRHLAQAVDHPQAQ